MERKQILVCPECGRIEKEPFIEGDSCYELCEGKFEIKNL